jgi:hypothetical protein
MLFSIRILTSVQHSFSVIIIRRARLPIGVNRGEPFNPIPWLIVWSIEFSVFAYSTYSFLTKKLFGSSLIDLSRQLFNNLSGDFLTFEAFLRARSGPPGGLDRQHDNT